MNRQYSPVFRISALIAAFALVSIVVLCAIHHHAHNDESEHCVICHLLFLSSGEPLFVVIVYALTAVGVFAPRENLIASKLFSYCSKRAPPIPLQSAS